ncbi:hypothetical protein HXX76_009631 [Chlamydomonas incerta]|uniref:Uncharacterized protein n=1 Tax=Chlamydomonas incerta TaxID=51695 RepID=A0A835T268_CHLIN|nr:hypothetical protein HXX76_009631 [Chlamydomonas incerta]|eukprot:KAG2431100.1 hypothetical protein HXX76_009631 [Chlamydomonas incerta]
MEDTGESEWSRLTPAVFRQIAEALHPDDVTSSFKFASKEVMDCLRDDYNTFQLRQKQATFCPVIGGAMCARDLGKQPWPGGAFVAHWGRPEPWRALNRRQRHTLLCLAASSGHAASLDVALAHAGTAIKADALASAAASGDCRACQRVLEGGCSWVSRMGWLPAAANGHVGLMRWMAEAGLAIDDTDELGELPLVMQPVVAAACFAGHRGVLRWFAERWVPGKSFDPYYGDSLRAEPSVAAAAAAEGGQVALLRELLAAHALEFQDYKGAEPRHAVLAGAAYGCPLAVLQQYCELWGSSAEADSEDTSSEGDSEGEAEGVRVEGAAAAMVRRRQDLLLFSATSPTPDWAAKVDWLLLRWGGSPGWPQESGRGFRYYRPQERNAIWVHAAAQPGYVQRLQHLTAAHGLELPAEAVEAAGAAGDVAAAAFCLGLPPVLSMAAGKGTRREPPAQLLGLAAAAAGQVPVLRLLGERGAVLACEHVKAALPVHEWQCDGDRRQLELGFPGLPALRHLAMGGGLGEPAAEQVRWSAVFRIVAELGADLALLRHLAEQRGAAVDLEAVASGGSEEQLQWALGHARAGSSDGGKVDTSGAFEAALLGGNWAAASYLQRRNLDDGAKSQQQLQELFCWLATRQDAPSYIPALHWLQQQYELQWTPACLSALDLMAKKLAAAAGYSIAVGQRQQWLAMRRAARRALGLAASDDEGRRAAEEGEAGAEGEADGEEDGGAEAEEERGSVAVT